MKTFKTFLKENEKKTFEIHSSGDYKRLMGIINAMTIDKGLSYDDAIFDVSGNVDMSLKNISSIPVQFGEINGNFNISNNNIRYLENSPKKCKSFICTGNKLKSLEDGPQEVADEYRCSSNLLETLEGAPSKARNFYATDNKLTSLKGCPAHLDLLVVTDNKITSLKDVHKHLLDCEQLNLHNNYIQEGGIGLIFVKNLKQVTYLSFGTEFSKALTIISKYYGQGRTGLLACQQELEEAGLDEFAKL